MVQVNYKVAIVILNYLNYQDTIECIESIFQMQYEICGIVVVDNGSENDSYKILKERFKSNVHVIKTPKNIGFARGNNYGIAFARNKLHAQFVLCVNNDTIFTDSEYIHKLVSKYESGVGVIGSKIILRNGKEQAPIKDYLEIKDTFYAFINAWSYERGSSFDFQVCQGKSTNILHGCALMFTPDFFKYYKGFYKKTFLYGEEPILYLMCKCKGLSQVYVKETRIYHKEDQSSEMSFNNDVGIKGKYSRQSRKYIFYWALKRYFAIKIHL